MIDQKSLKEGKTQEGQSGKSQLEEPSWKIGPEVGYKVGGFR